MVIKKKKKIVYQKSSKYFILELNEVEYMMTEFSYIKGIWVNYAFNTIPLTYKFLSLKYFLFL